MKLKSQLVSVWLLFLPSILFSSDIQIDSSLLNLKNHKGDTLSSQFALLLIEAGNGYAHNEYYFEAGDFYLKSLKIAEQLENRPLILKNLIHLGVAAFWTVQSDDAINYLQRALADYSDLATSQDSANIYQTLGNVYYDMGKMHLSYVNTLRSVEINRQQKKPQVEGDSYYLLAKMDVDRKKYESGLEHINKAAQIYQSMNNLRDLAFCYDVLAQIYLETRQFDLAMEYAVLSCEIDDNDEYKQYYAAYCAQFIGEIYEGMEDFTKAEAKYIEAMKIMNESDQYGELTDAKAALGKLYSITGKCIKSIELLNESLEEAQKLNLRPIVRDIYNYLFQAHNNCGNYKKAVEFLQKHSALKDSLVNESNMEELARLSSENELFQRKQELEILRKEKKLQNVYGFVISGAALVLLVFLLFGAWSLRKQFRLNNQLKANNKTIENQNKKLSSTIKRLKNLNTELQQFAYVVSHDLKAPLRGIFSLASFIEEDLSSNISEETRSEIFTNLNLMKGRIIRMENLINGILEYSRIGRKDTVKEPIDLNKFLPETIDLLTPPDNTKILLPQNLPTLFAVGTNLQQIFQNILSNGIKYNDKAQCEIRIEYSKLNKFHKFSISDNGPGIPKEYHKKVFGIFQTLQPRDQYESTGVGLSIVKKQVENLGGKIWIESQPGKETIFHFTIKKTVTD